MEEDVMNHQRATPFATSLAYATAKQSNIDEESNQDEADEAHHGNDETVNE